MDMEITDEILNGTFEQKREFVRQFNLMDDDFLAVALQDKAACRYFLQTFTKIYDLEVANMQTHHVIDNFRGHFVILNVFARDSKNKRYNVVIQVDNHHHNLRRTSFYRWCIDHSILERSKNYNLLPDIYSIYITSHDTFGLNRNHYEVVRIISGTNIKVDDGVHELYYNTKITESNEFDAILKFLKNSDSSNMNFGELSKSVKLCKETEEGVSRMCREIAKYSNYEKTGNQAEQDGK